MSVIEEMFYGDISSESMQLNKPSQELLNKVVECENKIKNQIKDKKLANDLIMKLHSADNMLNIAYDAECFKFGYVLGVHMMIEVFQQDIV